MNQSLLAEVPALPPPPGMYSNFDNPSALKPIFIAALSLMLFLTTLAVGARLVVKIYIIKSIQLEDYLSIAAGLGFIPWIAISFLLCNIGAGHHQWDISVLDGFQILRFANIEEILYGPIICAAKVSILVQFLRIFVPRNQGMIFWIIHCFIWTNVGIYAAHALALTFACTPREKIWHPYIPGRCINIDAEIVTTGSWNVISDISILILPLHCIRLLQIPIKRKLGVSAVFAAGLFACISSVCRLTYSVNHLLTPDKLYTFQEFGMWGIAEVTTLILCGCLPVLPRLRQVIKRKPSSASSNGRTYKMDRTPRSDKSKSNPSNPSQSSTTTWVESGYVPLSELSPTAVLSQGANGDDVGHGGIQKTVRIETHLQDNIC